jgi:hypothetical protein
VVVLLAAACAREVEVRDFAVRGERFPELLAAVCGERAPSSNTTSSFSSLSPSSRSGS